MGIEINPFFVNLASTKLRWYEVEPSSVRPLINEILSTSHSDCGTQVPPELSSFQRLYSQEVLTELLQLKSRILSATYGDDVSRDFLLLGLTAILELTSHAYKTGKGLKFRKRRAIRSVDDVRERVRQRWQDMLFDVEELSHQLRSQRIVLGESRVVQGDARQLPVDDASAALIIYSPPYANTFDYNEVYKLEMWFGEFVTSYKEWRQAKEGSLRSHVSLRIGSQTEGDELLEEALSLIPGQPRGEKEMLRAYFADMGEALAEQCRIAKKGAQVVIIVGNSSYRNVPIATDLILARIASTRGLKVEKIHVGRYLNTSSQQMAIYKSQGDTEARKFIRESAVILRK